MRTLSLAGLLLGSLLSPSRAAEGPKRPNVVLIIADDMAWDDCGAFGQPDGPDAEHRQAGPRGHAVRPGLRHGQLVQPQPVQPHHRALPAQHRRRGAALAAAARAGHVRRGAQGRPATGPPPPGSGTWATPSRAGSTSCGRRTRRGSSSPDGEGRQGPDDRRRLGRRPRAAATSGCPCCGTAPRTGRSSSGWPPSTRTGTTSRGPSPSRTGPRTSWSRPTCPTCPRSARTWPSTTTRSAASTATSAR